MKKVIFVSSSGGHLTEILSLSELFKEYEYLLVTEKIDITKSLQGQYNIDYLVYGPNRNIFKYLVNFFKNIVRCIKIVRKFKPDTIVTTGAQVGGIMCTIGKIFGAKIIYIESVARINTLSKTGKLVYKFADKFYVQWDALTKKYKKCEYIGRLI